MNVPLDVAARDSARLLVETLESHFAAGFFPAAPNKDECKFCVAKQLCPADRTRIVERKSGAKARKGIDRIREVE